MQAQSATLGVSPALPIWPLPFADKNLEVDFRKSYWSEALPYARFAMLSAALLGASFGVLDSLVADYALSQLFAIRFGFMVPVILVGFAISFVPFFKTKYHVVVMISSVVVGGSIILMIAFMKPPSSDYYYAGLIMVLIFTYTFLQLRLVHATIAALILFLGYEYVALIFRPSPIDAVINNTFFLVAANYGGMFACYTIERYRRQKFLQFHEIEYRHQETHRAKTQLERISSTDDLTSLFNRRQLVRSLGDLVNEFSVESEPIALVLIDLDNFKMVNDSSGHVSGDEVLKEVASLLTSCSAPTDLVFRYGGDEFVIILPGESALSGTNTALGMMSNFRRWAKNTTIAQASGLGMSIGITEVSSSTDTLKTLMAYADDALYQAKKWGKGRIVVIPRSQGSDHGLGDGIDEDT